MSDKKDFRIYNKTGYDISKLVLRHAVSMTEPHGDKVTKVDTLKDGDHHSFESSCCKSGLNDYWYFILNLMVPEDDLKLKKVDKDLIEDGKFPVALSNSKGWKQLDVYPNEDKGAHFTLTLDHKIAHKDPRDIKVVDTIKPTKSNGDDHWLEPVGHGGEDPLFALVYPAIPVGAILACIAADVLAGYVLKAGAEASFRAVEIMMASLSVE